MYPVFGVALGIEASQIEHNTSTLKRSITDFCFLALPLAITCDSATKSNDRIFFMFLYLEEWNGF